MDIFSKEIVVGTHDGCFHADEALGCYLLEILATNGMKIIRTRNSEQLKHCDIVLDVGGEYSHKRRRYDHHQASFEETFSDKYKEKLSSAGLIYRHYGMMLLAKLLWVDINEPSLAVLYNEVYDGFIYIFDCIDNGVSAVSSETNKLYDARSCSVFTFVQKLNPCWNDKSPMPDCAFRDAVRICGMFFENYTKNLYLSAFPARKIVDAAFEKIGSETDERILILEQNVPFVSHLKHLEKKNGKDFLFCVSKRTDGNWSVKCCTKEGSQFESKLPLSVRWRGLRESELCAVSEIKDAVFVHATGFLGVAKSKKSAIKMAEITMKEAGLFSVK